MDDLNRIEPGTVVVHHTGSVYTVSRRKDDNSGWWLEGGGGLWDRVLREGWGTEWRAANIDDCRRFFALLGIAHIVEMADGSQHWRPVSPVQPQGHVFPDRRLGICLRCGRTEERADQPCNLLTEGDTDGP